MDGRGRVFDNIFVERLWRTVKYEDVYLKGYATMGELLIGLTQYFAFYNGERAHQALGNQTPEAVYRSGTGGGASSSTSIRARACVLRLATLTAGHRLCGEHHNISSRTRAALCSCTSH